MALQESLHWAVGRGRSKVAIGIDDLDTVKPPFHYIASRRSRKFIPLDFTEKMSSGRDPRKAPEGKGLCKDREGLPPLPADCRRRRPCPVVPSYYQRRADAGDSRDEEHLLDTTGTDKRAVGVAVNITVPAMAEAGARIESVEINSIQTPTLAPVERTVSVRQCSRPLGIGPDGSLDGSTPRKDAVRCTARWHRLG